MGVEPDERLARTYFEQAARQDYAPSQNNLGVSYILHGETNKKKAEGLEHLEAAAELGYIPSLFNLGNVYSEGKIGGKNYGRAATYFEEAADKGDPYSQFNLGLMYVLGRGVDRDLVQGYSWLVAAEHAGVVQAKSARLALEVIIEPDDALSAKLTGLSKSVNVYIVDPSSDLNIPYEELYAAPELLNYYSNWKVWTMDKLLAGSGAYVLHPWTQPFPFEE